MFHMVVTVNSVPDVVLCATYQGVEGLANGKAQVRFLATVGVYP